MKYPSFGVSPGFWAHVFSPLLSMKRSQQSRSSFDGSQSGSIQYSFESSSVSRVIFEKDTQLPFVSFFVFLIVTWAIRGSYTKPRNVSHLGDEYKPFLPCHYFDYIAGTSTGGLIAIMLGRFRMTVDDCIHEYLHLAGKVFGRPRYLHYMNSPIPRCKYNTKKFEEVIKNVIIRRVEQGKENPQNVRFDTEHGSTMPSVSSSYDIFVIANLAEGVANEHRFFRSYEISTRRKSHSRRSSFTQNFKVKHSGRPGDVCVWHVARATTAAPMYFRPLEFMTGSKMRREPTMSTFRRRSTMNNGPVISHSSQVEKLEDGGFGAANNPSKEMYDELKSQLPSNMEVGTFVSIGTARPMEQPTGPRLLRVIRNGIYRLGDPEPTHRHMENLAEDIQPLSYFRFNKPDGLAGVKMDAWKPSATGQETIEKMTNAFNAHIGEMTMGRSMRLCAKELVMARRARVDASMPKWKRFALGRYFRCDVDDCSDEGQREIDEAKFRVHLRNEHMLNDREIEKALERCAHQWTYRGIDT
ncbi:FabD/lysophospholipase-like protein [Hypoxylon sp. FL1857]|nr:FabD/lysophospholipase-like protein [Hypoxylon sp. FL1857]